MKGYTVFNVEQIDGLPAHYTAKAEPAQPVERIEQAEAFFAAAGVTIRHGGNRAFYAPSLDFIQLPPRESLMGLECKGRLTHRAGAENAELCRANANDRISL